MSDSSQSCPVCVVVEGGFWNKYDSNFRPASQSDDYLIITEGANVDAKRKTGLLFRSSEMVWRPRPHAAAMDMATSEFRDGDQGSVVASLLFVDRPHSVYLLVTAAWAGGEGHDQAKAVDSS